MLAFRPEAGVAERTEGQARPAQADARDPGGDGDEHGAGGRGMWHRPLSPQPVR